MKTGSEVVDLTCGLEHACVRFKNKEAACLQLNRIDDSESQYSEGYLDESVSSGVEKIYAGNNITCVLKNNLKIVCAGRQMLTQD